MEQRQRERIGAVRRGRDAAAVESALAALTEGAAGDANLMSLIVDAARARATEGEIVDAMKAVFGGYREPPRV